MVRPPRPGIPRPPLRPPRPGIGWWSPRYYARYPGAWAAAGIAATAWWTTPAWGTTVTYCGCSDNYYTYEYGDSITYEDGTVYYGSEPVASAEQYYEQATTLASSGAETQNEEWLPLGVFAVMGEEEQTRSDKVIQLAVNKEGVIRGNFHDTLTDKVVSVVGAVDKNTQRVALRPADAETPVVECGLWNLTQESLNVLVHFGQERVETRGLLRLDEPQDEAGP